MKYYKPLTAAAIVASLAVGGAGIAAAGNDGVDREVDGTEVGALEVQLENEDTGDVEQDGDVERDDRGDRRDRRDGRNGRNGRSGERLASVAEAIGIEGEDLHEQLQAGATVAEVAEANGVAVADVVDALIADVEERLDQKVADGELTQEEADERLESKTERITNKVNGIDETTEETTDA